VTFEVRSSLNVAGANIRVEHYIRGSVICLFSLFWYLILMCQHYI